VKKLSDKVIVITGGSLGIGLEVAKQCVAEGAKVVIAARDEGSLKTACSLLDEVSSCERFFYRLDIGNYQEVKSFASWCRDKFGAVYGLVNCAGIYGPIGKTYKVDIAKFAETIQINFLGVVHMCHAFIPLMKSDSRKKSSIIRAAVRQRHFPTILPMRPAKSPPSGLPKTCRLNWQTKDLTSTALPLDSSSRGCIRIPWQPVRMTPQTHSMRTQKNRWVMAAYQRQYPPA